jgi:hypothetical protein
MVVNLNNVTAIHRSAYLLLSSMVSAGADVVASGVFNRHLLEELKKKATRHPRNAFQVIRALSSSAELSEAVRAHDIVPK